MATGIVNPYAVASAEFNPETDIGWHTLFWAEGTKYKATNSVNGAQITRVPDEYGAAADDATMATGSPYFTHRTGTAGVLNGQPHWLTTYTHGQMTTGTWSKAVPSGPTTSLIIICEPDGVNRVGGMLIDGPMAGNGYGFVHDNLSSLGFRIYGQNSIGLTNFNTGHLLTGGSVNAIRISRSTIFTDAYIHLNSLAPIPFGSAGTGGFSSYGYPNQGVQLNSFAAGGGTYPFHGAMPFVGIYDGQISSHAKWNDLQAWALSHYGATLT